MNKNFEIDVTNLIEKVKKQNLLFYPVIIYIFVKTLHICGFKDIIPAYINTYQPELNSVLFQDFDASFEIFFNQYIKNCFQNQSSNTNQGSCILFSHLPTHNLNLGEIKTPVFVLNPFKQKDNRTYLSFYLSDLNIGEPFLSVVQDLCDSF